MGRRAWSTTPREFSSIAHFTSLRHSIETMYTALLLTCALATTSHALLSSKQNVRAGMEIRAFNPKVCICFNFHCKRKSTFSSDLYNLLYFADVHWIKRTIGILRPSGALKGHHREGLQEVPRVRAEARTYCNACGRGSLLQRGLSLLAGQQDHRTCHLSVPAGGQRAAGIHC